MNKNKNKNKREREKEKKKEKEKEKKNEQILYRGLYRGTSKNFGFVTLLDTDNLPDIVNVGSGDIFIPEECNKLKAIHDDEVMIKIVPSSSYRSKTGYEGVVVELLKRNFTWCVGILKIKNGEYYVTSGKKGGSLDIYITRSNLNGAVLDDIVKVHLTKPSLDIKITKPKRRKKFNTRSRLYIPQDKIYGMVEQILGKKQSTRANYESILLSHGILQKFDDKLVESAEKIAANGLKKLKNNNHDSFGREDLRDKTVFTIDGYYAKDLDDAISIEVDEDKNYVLGVHIADVSHYVKHKSPLDMEAYSRGTSVYFIDEVVPMLPEALSNGVCSLNEGEHRFCLSAFMTINRKGEMIKSRFAKTIINSKVKGIYSEINQIFAATYKNSRSNCAEEKPEDEQKTADLKDLKKKYKAVMPSLRKARSLAQILKKRRIKNGSLELISIESEFITSKNKETGELEIEDIKRVPQGESESLIEEFMLKANEAVAKFLTEKNYPCVYRVHEKPYYEKIETFVHMLRHLGYSSSALKNLLSKDKEIHPKDLQKILNHFRDTPLFQTVNLRMLRSLAKARYSEKNFGHFGLASDEYCHFTSPIRRYPDLVNHRILKAAIAGYENTEININEIEKSVALVARQSSEKETNAVAAEREIEDLYKTIYMSRHIGEVHEGTITSVMNFGIFVMLENTCEGLVHISDMAGYFELDSSAMELRGDTERYRVGQKVLIKVISADIISGTMNFLLWL